MVVEPGYLLVSVAATLLAYVLGASRNRRKLRTRVEDLRVAKRQLEATAAGHRLTVAELRDRLAEAQQGSANLETSLLELPEIAQRLAATRNQRDIPGAALDLICEIFKPSYCVFYRMRQGGLVTFATRGDTPHEIGHRVKVNDGLIGWAAVRQMALSCYDVGELAIDEHDDDPSDFTLALPVVSGNITHGVILIGPTGRDLPRARDSAALAFRGHYASRASLA